MTAQENKTNETRRRQISTVVVPPFVRAAAKLHLSPNALTLIGLVICMVAAVIVGMGHLLVGGLVMLFSGLFDMLDGAVARASGKVTKFGGLMDSVADRASEAALLSALLVLYTFRGSTPGVLLAIAALTGSFFTSYIRARAEGLGIDCKVGVLTRAERVIVLGLGLVLDQFTRQYGALVAVSIIAVFSYITVFQRMVHVWKQTREARG